MGNSWVWAVVAGLSLLIAITALTLAITITKRVSSRDPIAVPKFWRRVLRIRTVPPAAEALGMVRDGTQRVAFIANPTKTGIAEVREQALRACSIRYLPQPMWLWTTAEDPGTGQAQTALAQGVDLIVAVGGDGTVRAVAEAVAGTSVALAIVPMGTGNIFARNYDLPLEDIPALLRTALEGEERQVDVGRLELVKTTGDTQESTKHLFLVMAGAGLDAEMVSGANDRLKRRIGWLAYFLAAIRHMGERRITASVSVNGSKPLKAQIRTVLLANVGKLPGGFQLIPDASSEDGILDIATLDARAGIVGWTELFGNVVAQGVGFRQPQILKAWGASRIDHASGQEVEIIMEKTQPVQVDGELLGHATHLRAVVEAGVLKLRVPPQHP